MFCRINMNTKRDMPVRAGEMGMLIYIVKSFKLQSPIRIADFFRSQRQWLLAQLDIKGEATFDIAINGADSVFLMRPPNFGKPEDLYPFIGWRKKAGIKLVWFLSLMSVENNTIPPHHKIEEYIEKMGFILLI